MVIAWRRIHGERRPDVGLARRIAHLERFVVHADVVGRHVEQLGLRRIGCRLLVLGTKCGRADTLVVVILSVLVGRILRYDLRTTICRRVLVHVDAAGPVDLRVILLGYQQFARLTVERVAQAVTVEMGQQLACFAIDRLIREDHFVDAVVVPFVMRRHLIDPVGHTRIRVACENGHRPFVVAGALLRIPGRGIARPVIDEVQSRIVGEPAPCAAAADLPLIALPCLQTGVLADGLAERGGLDGVDQDLIVRAFRESTPRLFAVLDVVCGDVTLHAEFTAGNADQDLVLDDQRSGGAGATLGRVAILHRPRDLSGFRVKRNQRRVCLMQEYLAIAIGHAAIDGVAAHHWNDVGILLGFVLPDDPVVLGRIEREDRVRERRMHIHHIADDERSTFVTAQDAGRKRPCHLKLADVGGRDLFEFGIALITVVACRHHPVFRVLRHFN